MSRKERRENYERKVKCIKNDFKSMNNERTESGKNKYTLEFMLERLAKKYFLDKTTIYKIINK